MLDCECQFVSLQLTNNLDYSQTQSFSYGDDVEMEDIVSLEYNGEGFSQLDKQENISGGHKWCMVVYDNVEIEDISSDEEVDKL